MKKFVKNFIGKGKKVNGLEIIKVTLNMKDLENFSYEFNTEQYVTLEVAKMKVPDQFGREYTCYVTRQEEVEETTETKKEIPGKKTSKKRTKKAKEELAELPL